MKASEFCYWLQGLFELGEPTTLDAKQTDLIKRHLALVFLHDIDPKAGGAEVQAKLNEVHGGSTQVVQKPTHIVPGFGGVGPDGMVYRC